MARGIGLVSAFILRILHRFKFFMYGFHLFPRHMRAPLMEIQPKPFRVVIVSLQWMRVAHHLPRDFFAFRIGFVAVHVDNCYAHMFFTAVSLPPQLLPQHSEQSPITRHPP